MSARSESQTFLSYQKIITHLRTPLYRNGYLLIFSSLATSGIGLLYWIIAARRYPTELVGLNSAVIAAMILLAGISQLNLMSALIRFIPTAGRSTKRFVAYSYLVSLAVAAGVSYVFIQNISNWSPALGFLGDSPVLSTWFILSTMSWAIFVLQDSVLTGLRQTSWVPLENIIFSLVKIVFMVILASIVPSFGIFASWSLGVLVILLPTNYFIFRKLIPDHIRQDEQLNGHVEPKQVIRFVAADYVGAISWMLASHLMPVIVTTVLGAEANAYYYLSWTIANTLYLIGPSMGSSMVVEAAKNQDKLGTYSYRVFKNAIKIVIPAVIVLLIAAPYILMVFGSGYSSAGADLLRLLALSTIPSTINTIYVSVARVQRRMKSVIAVLGSLCVLVLALSYMLLLFFGITGIGIGWLISQSIVAVIVYMTQLRKIWRKGSDERIESKENHIGVGMGTSLVQRLFQLTKSSGVYPILTRTRKKFSTLRRSARVSQLLPDIIKDIPGEIYNPIQSQWKVQWVASNETNTTIAFLGPVSDSPPLVLKLPGSHKEIESLNKQSQNLAFLNDDERLGEWRQLLPVIVSKGKIDKQVFFTESVLPGGPVRAKLDNPESSSRVIHLATSAIGTLHQKTAETVVVSISLLNHWIGEPLINLARFNSNGSTYHLYQKAIDQLNTQIRTSLIGQEVCISWIHGDYSPSNVLINSDGSEITGIVDWDLARPGDLPLLDLIHFFISVRMEMEQCEMGQVVSTLLLKENWTPEESDLIQAAEKSLPGNSIGLRVLVLLSWLHHINANLTKTSRFDHHNLWASMNIVPVLTALQRS